MAGRGLGLRLPGPHLRRPLRAAPRPGRGRGRAASRARRGRARRERPQRAGPGARRLPVAVRPGLRRVLGAGRRGRHPRRHPRRQRRLRRPRPDVGARRGRELAVPFAPSGRRHQEPGRHRLLRRRDLPRRVRPLPGAPPGERRERGLVDPRPAVPARRRRQPQPRLLRPPPERHVPPARVGHPVLGGPRRRTGRRHRRRPAPPRLRLAPRRGHRAPYDFVTDTLAGLDDAAVERIAWANATELLGLSLDRNVGAGAEVAG